MSIKRVVPNIASDRVEQSKQFYTALLGFQVAMDMDWIVTLASPSHPTAQISLMRAETSDGSHEHPILSIEVADVDEIHTRALSDGHEIVYPLTDEPWGVRRFYVKDPNGMIINVMSHIG